MGTKKKHSVAPPTNVLHDFDVAQNSLVLQASDVSLGTISSMVGAEAIDLEPEFQRRVRWGADDQAQLIESFLLNIPVPPIYLAESEGGALAVIDGKQRITAIHKFMTGELVLTGLQRYRSAENYRYGDFPAEIRHSLSIRPYLRVVTLLRQSQPHLRYEVFLRLNKAGHPLNAQEIRNVAFRGKLNDLIYELAREPFLVRQLKITDLNSPAYTDMLDAEAVLRFFTVYETWEDFPGNYRRAMDEFMLRGSQLAPAEVRQSALLFKSALERCAALWGDKAFRRFESGQWRDQFLFGLYDAQMVAVALLQDDEVEKLVERREQVLNATKDLFGSYVFDTAVRVGTNTPSRVRLRVQMVLDMLTGIADGVKGKK